MRNLTQKFILFFMKPVSVLVALFTVVGLYFKPLSEIIMISPWLNGAILGIILLGIILVFFEIFRVYREFSYVSAHQPQKLRLFPNPDFPFSFPILQWCHTGMHTQVQIPLAQCEKRLEQCRKFSQFLAGLLVFMGLLGTLWGLSRSVIIMSDMFQNITAVGGDTTFLDLIKTQLSESLSKMGLAFSSSLLGLSGSVLIHFFVLHLREIQSQWYDHITQWVQEVLQNKASTELARRTALEESFTPENIIPILNALMNSLEGFSNVNKVQLQRCQDLTESFLSFSTKVQDLSDLMKAQHHILNKWAQEQMNSRHALELMGQKLHDLGFASDEVTRHALTKIMVCCEYLARQHGKETLEHAVS